MDGYVSLEAARALQQASFPQDQWPQMVWANISDGEPIWKVCLGISFVDMPDFTGEKRRLRCYGLEQAQYGHVFGIREKDWIAAPTYLAALQFGKSERGWLWKVDEKGYWHVRKWVDKAAFGRYLTATYKQSPGDLITEILRMERYEQML